MATWDRHRRAPPVPGQRHFGPRNSWKALAVGTSRVTYGKPPRLASIHRLCGCGRCATVVVRACIFVERLEVEIVEIVVAQVAERAVVLSRQKLLDDRCELVLFDEDRLGIDARMELDLVERLQVGRIGHRNEQAHAAPDQRQRVVLTNQAFFDEILRNRIEVERRKIDDRYAELFRCGGRYRAGVRKFVADQIADERQSGFAGVFTGRLCCIRVENAILDKASSESRKRYRLCSH